MDGHLKLLLQELRGGLEELYGDRLVQLVLYGSHARQQATEDSDIDVMVVLSGEISPATEVFRMGEIKTRLNLKHDDLISVLPVSEADFKVKTSPLLENVRREGVSV